MKTLVDRDEDKSLVEDIDILLGGPRRNSLRTLVVESGKEVGSEEMDRRRLWIVISPYPFRNERERCKRIILGRPKWKASCGSLVKTKKKKKIATRLTIS